MKALLAGLALLLAGPVAAAPAKPAAKMSPVTVIETGEGWTFGKAGAPLLAEYASYGCPHCGQFAGAIFPRVDGLVKAGKLRFAWRPFLIFPQDRATAVLTRCVAPARRLAFIEAVMAQQTEIKAALKAADDDETSRAALYEAELAGPISHAGALAKAAGLLPLAQKHGLTTMQASACLSNAAHHQWVTNADMTARLNGVTGTPTFMWKGAKIPTGTPDDLLAMLPQ
ncbi:protein-disulfide isomerase [Sphingomonas kaistensis]|uniref:Protein-disulfide isomerase n=1 Tax=Sphingomonas kaistensis TaxID=298708 RepID=A0A7X5Y509_9SPHN|nr:thioredoxin domain-containing protein [Sphingomonas kaistensis]NJC05299.1 protein-disulfide isomerase [Sphingomonas kaistensis]